MKCFHEWEKASANRFRPSDKCNLPAKNGGNERTPRFTVQAIELDVSAIDRGHLGARRRRPAGGQRHTTLNSIMITSDTQQQPGPSSPEKEKITLYYWLVVIIASAGWLFDCMDQRIFALSREPALREIMGKGASLEEVRSWGGWATTAMMIGWATGGIIFGIMSDRWGRVKTMVVTLLVYSGFTGLSGIAHSVTEFMIYRFLVGLGVGGMFGAATTLVAESVPLRVRAVALGSLQALSACGNIIGSLLSTRIHPGGSDVMFGQSGWRIMFFIGVLPALLVVPMITVLKEPEAWKAAKKRAKESADPSKHIGSIGDLVGHPRWGRNLWVGVCLGLAGMAGLWGIGFFSPELISTALKNEPQKVVDVVRGYGTALQDVGAFFGMLAFTAVATLVGRRPAFLMAFLACLGVTIYVFNNLRTGTDAYWMLPMMGFVQLSVFGGYAIYFPELFPTRLRGTGVGFCYNTVRYLAAVFPPLLMFLNRQLMEQGVHEPFRKAAMMLSFIFLLGLVALIWAPETKGKPLPED
ncbi:MAG: MFS transporter [Verrucomicrobia bacterium]|nr:MFS transporter [Verrucomicrobiota bacterium]